MNQPVISISNLTRDYGQKRGIFGIDLQVEPGQVFGYLGTNGSGKTTTIRHMMGFLKPEQGSVRVMGLDPWTRAPELMRYVSYIPGEIAFPSLKTGTDFFRKQAQYLGLKEFSRTKELVERMNLDPTASLKRMSKGMKQKTAIVAALMAPRDLLILDEPTTGLDPLMRETFLDLIREEKQQGHTVFMSSHIFEEIEDVCDTVGILQDGQLKEVLNLKEFRRSSHRRMEIRFRETASALQFRDRMPGAECSDRTVTCSVLAEEMNRFFSALQDLPVESLHEEHIGLEEYFMKLYRKEPKA